MQKHKENLLVVQNFVGIKCQNQFTGKFTKA